MFSDSVRILPPSFTDYFTYLLTYLLSTKVTRIKHELMRLRLLSAGQQMNRFQTSILSGLVLHSVLQCDQFSNALNQRD